MESRLECSAHILVKDISQVPVFDDKSFLKLTACILFAVMYLISIFVCKTRKLCLFFILCVCVLIEKKKIFINFYMKQKIIRLDNLSQSNNYVYYPILTILLSTNFLSLYQIFLTSKHHNDVYSVILQNRKHLITLVQFDLVKDKLVS